MNPYHRLEATRRNQAKKRDVLQKIKLERGCADCGYNSNAVALDFDHRDGEVKSFQLSKWCNHGLVELLREVEKCDVVCANCHRIRTVERGQHRSQPRRSA